MNCQETEKMMTIAVYGTLNEEQLSALEEHLSRCQSCQRRWERTAPLRERADRITRVPVPDPDRSWDIIAGRLSRGRRTRARRRSWRWVPAGATLLVIFAAGFYFGRRLLLVPSVSRMPWPTELSEISLEAYVDFLQPVLINFSNRGAVQDPAAMKRLERRIVSDLLARTRLFKSLIPEEDGSALWQLLQDLEFILTAMDNLESGDMDAASHLAELIRDNEVSLRLRQLIKTRTTL